MLEVSEKEEGVVALHLPIVTDDIATAPSGPISRA